MSNSDVVSGNYSEDLLKLIKDSKHCKKNNSILNELLNSDIYIYGAGNAGAMTYDLLKKINIEISGFIDNRSKEISCYMDKSVSAIENEIVKDNIFVIVSFLCSYEELEHIEKRLLSLGYSKICYFHDIYNLISKINFEKSKGTNYNKIVTNEKEKILEIEGYLCDKRSKQVYYDFYNALVNENSSLFSNIDEGVQYFVDDIIFEKGYECFIDCGAFDGDTVINLKKLKGEIEKAVLFEPEKVNFEKLKENIKAESIAKELILFPCGVWNKTELLTFKSGLQGSSSIAESGDVHVQCISLDDVLIGFEPTFIKMDIEGAEYEALLGAENIIKNYKPDLAISIYHKVEHIIEIPLLIKKFNPKYKLYLRCHGLHGMETVLYATSE